MDLFDTCIWADFIVETTFLGTPTIHFPRRTEEGWGFKEPTSQFGRVGSQVHGDRGF